MLLTSPQNPLLQSLRRAVQTGRPLDGGLVAAEGPHLLMEALGSGWGVEQVFCSSEGLERNGQVLSAAADRRIAVTEIGARAFNAISDTGHTQGVLSLLRPRTFTWPDLVESAGPLVILDGIQDPGNAGAIIRSTEAFGGAGLVFLEGCVRVSNGKLLRAAAGSLFRLPFLEHVPPADVIRHLKRAKGADARRQTAEQLRNSSGGAPDTATVLREFPRRQRTLFALTAKGRSSLWGTSLNTPFALVVGSEGGGVSPAILEASEPLYIPSQAVESLNAAVACSIALFEAARQRHCLQEVRP